MQLLFYICIVNLGQRFKSDICGSHDNAWKCGKNYKIPHHKFISFSFLPGLHKVAPVAPPEKYISNIFQYANIIKKNGN
jgi:hypothetical protein